MPLEYAATFRFAASVRLTTLERLPRFLLRFRPPVSEQQQPGRDEGEARRPARRRVVLRGVSGDAHQRFRIARRDPAHEDLTVVGMDQAGHQVHQRGLARAVRADQARDARRDVQRDPVHAEHFAVELRDLVEDHSGPPSRGPLCSALRRTRRAASRRGGSRHDLHRAQLALDHDDEQHNHHRQRPRRRARRRGRRAAPRPAARTRPDSPSRRDR